MIPDKIISDNEQDRAAAERWWKESSVGKKFAVWSEIQREYHDSPAKEVMSRLAQLAFGELVEKYGFDEDKP